MAKSNYYIACLLVFLYSLPLCLANDCLKQTYSGEIGVKEASGKNDGEKVEQYLNSVGLGKGYSWCAAFVKWCMLQCGISSTITAWSPSAHNSKNLVYFRQQTLKSFNAGDVFTIWYPSLKRIGHTGFYDAPAGEDMIYTVEGNTNDGGSRNGDGVYRRKRRLKTIYSISRWN